MEPRKNTINNSKGTGKRVPGASGATGTAGTAGRSALRGTEATAASTGAKPAGMTTLGAAGRSSLATSAATSAAQSKAKNEAELTTDKPIKEVKDGESSDYSEFDEEEFE